MIMTQNLDKTPTQLLAEYETYLDMFSTEGWKKFIEVNTEQLKVERENAHRTHASGDEWQVFRGYVLLMEKILGFEDAIDNTIDALKLEIAEADKVEEEPEEDEFPL